VVVFLYMRSFSIWKPWRANGRERPPPPRRPTRVMGMLLGRRRRVGVTRHRAHLSKIYIIRRTAPKSTSHAHYGMLQQSVIIFFKNTFYKLYMCVCVCVCVLYTPCVPQQQLQQLHYYHPGNGRWGGGRRCDAPRRRLLEIFYTPAIYIIIILYYVYAPKRQ